MDKHLRFCKRTYPPGIPDIPDMPNRAGAGLNIVVGRIENPVEGDFYFDHEEQASYVFTGEEWAMFTGVGIADGV